MLSPWILCEVTPKINKRNYRRKEAEALIIREHASLEVEGNRGWMQCRMRLKLLTGRQLRDLEGCHLFLPIHARRDVLLVGVLMQPQIVDELLELVLGAAIGALYC